MTDMTLDEIEALLEGSHIGRLSMADETGRPYILPFPFCWADATVYLRVPLTGRKGRILACNDHVCFEVDRFSDELDDYASVLVEGRLVEVADTAEKARVKAVNDRKYTRLRRGHRPGHGRARPVSDLPLRKILIERMSGRRKESAAAAAAG